jgi:1,4-dihydroxy-6-naphthoate synthase
MELSIGFSSCPNDTFIFDALVNHKIDTGKYTFKVQLADIEKLNKMSSQSILDISKLSYGTYFNVSNRYTLLRSGGALGTQCGPLLIAARPFDLKDIATKTIAIPGKGTTAAFLLNFAFPNIHKSEEHVFSEIEALVLNHEVDAGVIIHENRFTYAEKGLTKLIDLGEYWEEKINCPIPLGCIAIRRDLGKDIALDIDQLIRLSIQFALQNPESSADYVRSLAQEMDPDVIKAHIDLYVNDYSIDIGESGLKAISTMAKWMGLDSDIEKYYG